MNVKRLEFELNDVLTMSVKLKLNRRKLKNKNFSPYNKRKD